MLMKKKIHYLEQLAKECNEKGTRLVFVASPSFRGGNYNRESFSVITKISNEYKITFLYYFESGFSEDPIYFKDSHHLNNTGSEAFTKEIASLVCK